MVRRSFRIGLRLGLLLGAMFALVKTVQARRSRDAGPAPAWAPLEPSPPPPVDEVGEPISEPSPPAPPPPPPARPVSVPAEVESQPVAPLVAEVEMAEVEMAAVEIAEPAPPPAEPESVDVAPLAAATPTKAAPKRRATARARGWVEAEGSVCPPSHPIKAKLRSRLFHLPGMFAYDRTNPDRCYANERTAVKDGFVKAKR